MGADRICRVDAFFANHATVDLVRFCVEVKLVAASEYQGTFFTH